MKDPKSFLMPNNKVLIEGEANKNMKWVCVEFLMNCFVPMASDKITLTNKTDIIIVGVHTM